MRIILIIFIAIFLFGYNDQTPRNDSGLLDTDIIANTGRYDLTYFIKSDSLPYKELGDVYVTTFDTSKKICFKNCYKPVLSSDGKKLLINKLFPTDSINRVIVDLNSMEEFKCTIPYSYASQEAWSPDNNYIAYQASFSQVGIAKSDNSDFRILDFSADILTNLPAWTRDGNYIITGNASYVFSIGVKQNTIDTIFDSSKIIDSSFVGINGYACLSSDNKYLIINAMVNEIQEGNVPPLASSIYAYNLNFKKLIRLTPKGLSTGNVFLGLNNEVYFTGVSDIKKNIYGIYKVSIENKKMTKIIEHAYFTSCRYKD